VFRGKKSITTNLWNEAAMKQETQRDKVSLTTKFSGNITLQRGYWHSGYGSTWKKREDWWM